MAYYTPPPGEVKTASTYQRGMESMERPLRELMIHEIHTKGHHSADRNLRYATEYIYLARDEERFPPGFR